MNIKKIIAVLLLSASWIPAAQACSIMDVWEAWRYAADTDKDGQINLDEWRQMRRSESARAFKRQFRLSRAKFRRLDEDGNGLLDEKELSDLRDKLAYVRSPCADWEAEMRRRIIR